MPAVSRTLLAIGAGSCLLTAIPSRSWAQVSLELMGGAAFNAGSPLKISQAGQPDLSFTAHYSTKPLRTTQYYAFRVGLWSGRAGWVVDFLHHKLYLENPPPEVQVFQITYGYNLLTVSRAWRLDWATLSLGAGPVIGNPSSEIRGKLRPHSGGILGGYYLSGLTLLGGANRRAYFARRVFATFDAQMSASYARVPVAEGHAVAPNLALHLKLGLGYGKRPTGKR
ncbi:MAG: hypothetical protein ACREMO_06245 [Gemmatimonadales bacterium]